MNNIIIYSSLCSTPPLNCPRTFDIQTNMSFVYLQPKQNLDLVHCEGKRNVSSQPSQPSPNTRLSNNDPPPWELSSFPQIRVDMGSKSPNSLILLGLIIFPIAQWQPWQLPTLFFPFMSCCRIFGQIFSSSTFLLEDSRLEGVVWREIGNPVLWCRGSPIWVDLSVLHGFQVPHASSIFPSTPPPRCQCDAVHIYDSS